MFFKKVFFRRHFIYEVSSILHTIRYQLYSLLCLIFVTPIFKVYHYYNNILLIFFKTNIVIFGPMMNCNIILIILTYS